MSAYEALEGRRKNQCNDLFGAIMSKEELNRSVIINCHRTDVAHLFRGKIDFFLYVESTPFLTISYKLNRRKLSAYPEWKIEILDQCLAHREEMLKLLTLYASGFLKEEIVNHLCVEEKEVVNA